MSERSPEIIPASAEQASAVFAAIGELTTLQGTHDGYTHWFATPIDMPPEIVALRFPEPLPETHIMGYEFGVTQFFDVRTGEPWDIAVLGAVTFSRQEDLGEDWLHTTSLHYQVHTNPDETVRLECRTESTQHATGPLTPNHDPTSVVVRAVKHRRFDRNRQRDSFALLPPIVTDQEATEVLDLLAQLNGSVTS